MSVAVLIVFHSSSELVARQVSAYFAQNSLVVSTMTEGAPISLSARADAVERADAFMAITNRRFQNTPTCVELVCFAKDLGKPLYAVNTTQRYQPFGSLGAILANAAVPIVQLDDEADLFLQRKIDVVLGTLQRLTPKPIPPPRPQSASPVSLTWTNIVVEFLILYCPDAEMNAKIVQKGLESAGHVGQLEDGSQSTSSVLTSRVIIIVMSRAFEASPYCRAAVETARGQKKPIIPISISRQIKPVNWLALTIAGQIFYRIFDETQAYTKKYDSTPMKNLIFECEKALSPGPTQRDRDKALALSLNKQIEECRGKMDHWPPVKRKPMTPVQRPVKIDWKPLKEEKFAYNHQHYEVTRIDFVPPRTLFDAHGVPLREKLDCMISYQWGCQELVQFMYMDLKMCNLNIWFDISGGMGLDSNLSMATAVECSSVILIFLTKKYIQSPNCLLEIRYAIMRKKALIFVYVEPELVVDDWLIEHVNASSAKFIVTSTRDTETLENGVPKIQNIAQAIRDIGAAQPNDDTFELSDYLYDLTETLEDALDDIASSTNKQRFKMCQRCKKQYEEGRGTMECRKHNAYFMGGNIIRGRWVCCNQADQNAIGCSKCEHTDVPQVFLKDPHYGTYTFVPATK